MGGKEDVLELSLSLGPKDPMHSASHHEHPKNHYQRSLMNSKWNHQQHFQFSDTKMKLFGGFSINRPPPPLTAPEAIRDDDIVETWSPNSTLSSVSGKRGEREERAASSSRETFYENGNSDAEKGDGSADGGEEEETERVKKKLRLSKKQISLLEETFKQTSTLNPKQKVALAKQVNLKPRQVEVWFQNRRARTKQKQTEVDCEYLRRFCETLSEENQRLQRELQELRALKFSSQQLFMHPPPTTLTMCPSRDHFGPSPVTSGTYESDMCRRRLGGPRTRLQSAPTRSWTPMHSPRLDFHGPRS